MNDSMRDGKADIALRNDPVIIKLDQAREALAHAKTMQDAKQIADIARAAEIYAKRQKMGQEAIDYAHAINIEALRRLGEMLADPSYERAEVGRPVNSSQTELLKPPTLAEVGLDRKISFIAQHLAALPEEEFNQVRNGTLSISRAVSHVAREKKRHDLSTAAADPTSKYRVLYADPPWAYNDTCDDGSVQSAGAAQHYPTMTMTELCALPVSDWCESDAVLFLWVTSPLLSSVWPLIEAWGFEYKASFVWDKVKHNMGHYNSVRHEFLLVCTRGQCTPDHVELFDSVQSIERTTHSTKPEEFRKIIDTLYPYGRRLEMFARGAHLDSWDTWGKEAGQAVVRH